MLRRTCASQPDPAAPDECPCARLAGPLIDGETLTDLDHVGPAAMRRSCAAWLTELLGPHAAPTRVSLGVGLTTIPVAPCDPWPLPVENSELQILIAVRQWIEGAPDAALGRILRTLPAWSVARNLAAALPDEEHARAALAWCALPATPGTARFLLGELDAGFPRLPGPTRGLYVTSLGLAPREGRREAHGQLISQITGAAPWVNDTLRRRAIAVQNEHARWWAAQPWARFPAADLRRFNRRPPDALTLLMKRYLEGKVDRAALEALVIQEALQAKGEGPLTPQERRIALRRIDTRLKRLDQRSGRVP